MAGLSFLVNRTQGMRLLGYDVCCAGTFLALLDVEGDGLSFSQCLESLALDGAVVHEDVFGSI